MDLADDSFDVVLCRLAYRGPRRIPHGLALRSLSDREHAAVKTYCEGLLAHFMSDDGLALRGVALCAQASWRQTRSVSRRNAARASRPRASVQPPMTIQPVADHAPAPSATWLAWTSQ